MWENLRIHFERDWHYISQPGVIAWSVFYFWFLWTFWTGRGFLMLFINVDLIMHEAGHLLFSYTGSHFLTILGGTLLQLIVPAALAFQFAYQRQPYGTTFAAFIFFQNFLYIGEYMADARSQGLALVSVGGGEAGHDWHYIFSTLGLLNLDIGIGRLTKFFGWIGMFAAVGWLVYRYRNNPEKQQQFEDF